MALILRYIDHMHDFMNKTGDPRTANWPLMSSPFPTLAICLSYVYFVKVLGPRIMENRKPIQLKNTLIAYNLFQVTFSAWIFYECLMGGWWNKYSFRCQPVDYSNSETALRLGVSGWFTGNYNFRCQPVDYSNHPKTIRMTHACWWYYFSKFTEFFDTVFFVLRKKNDHVSTLHVIHHGCMPMSVWFGVKFTPGGHSTFFGLLNTFVHIIMYTYYLLSAFGPHMQRYLWWKKYLTTLQMVQFILIVVHAFQLLFIDCNYPKAFVWWIGMHGVMFFFLFNEFYKQAYKSNQKKAAAAAKAKALNGTTNGTLKNGISNGTSNGTTNGTANGVSHGQKTIETSPKSAGTKVSDYYINGELTSGLHHRTGEIK